MGIYLLDNPPARSQFRSPRRAKPSGVIVVHTAESVPDYVAPDDGAENVARFIQRRSDAGSYHDLCDSDSIVQLVRYSDEAYGDGTGSNPHAYHVSAATQAHRWATKPPAWRDGCVRNMARAAARYARWVRDTYGITIPARRITRAQSESRMPGFISHAERDPARRTDPGAAFPWARFLDLYAAEMTTAGSRLPTLDPSEEDDMTPEQYATLQQVQSLLEAVAQSVGRAESNAFAAVKALPVVTRTEGTVSEVQSLLEAVAGSVGRAESNAYAAVKALTGVRGDLAAALQQEGADATPDQVEAALRRVLGSLDNQEV